MGKPARNSRVATEPATEAVRTDNNGQRYCQRRGCKAELSDKRADANFCTDSCRAIEYRNRHPRIMLSESVNVPRHVLLKLLGMDYEAKIKAEIFSE